MVESGFAHTYSNEQIQKYSSKLGFQPPSALNSIQGHSLWPPVPGESTGLDDVGTDHHHLDVGGPVRAGGLAHVVGRLTAGVAGWLVDKLVASDPTGDLQVLALTLEFTLSERPDRRNPAGSLFPRPFPGSIGTVFLTHGSHVPADGCGGCIHPRGLARR